MAEVDFHSAVGTTITTWCVDAVSASISRFSDVELPAPVQYAWRHPVLPLLYAAFSDRFSKGGNHHGVATLRIDPSTGRLSRDGEPLPLSNRPVHLCVNGAGTQLFVAYNDPSEVSMHSLDHRGRIAQAGPGAVIRTGFYAHQVRVAPDDSTVVVPARGNDATALRAEDPGSLEILRVRGASLDLVRKISPHAGFGFGPRHVDFHPNGKWMYVSVERQNELHMFELNGPSVSEEARFVVSTLESPAEKRGEQLAGAIHVSPDGRFVYVTNRANGTMLQDGRAVFSCGENNIAVFVIDPATGEPRPAGHAAVHGYHARTMALHPCGRMLVAATLAPMNVLDPAQRTITRVEAALSVFSVANNGDLLRTQTIEIDTGDQWLFWCAMVWRSR